MQSSPVLLEASIVTLVFGLALRGTRRELMYLGCRPRLLLRTFVAMNVLSPLLVMSALSALGLSSAAIVGATLLVISPGVPLVSQAGLKTSDRSELILAASAMAAVLSVLTVPIWLGVVSQLYLPDASIAPMAVIRLVATLFVLPLALAVILRRLAPSLARASGPLVLISDIILLLSVLTVSGHLAPAFRQLGVDTAVAIAGVSVGVLFIGHLAGGRDASDRSVLGVMSGMRHPGLALLIAKYNFDGDLVLPAVVASVLIGFLVTLAYAYWRRQRRRAGGLSTPPALATEGSLAPPASR